MEKNLSRQEVKVILDSAPKNLDRGKIIESLASKGYKMEGYNDQPIVKPQGAISQAFNAGVDKVKQGYNEAVNASNPLQLVEGSVKSAAGAVDAAFSPLASVMAPAGKVVNAVADKVSDIPAVQNFASSKAGEVTTRVVEDVANLNTLVGAVAGAEATPGAINKLKVTADNISKNASKALAEKTAQQTFNDTLNMVRPELSKLEKEAAISSGRGTTKGPLGSVEVAPSAREIEVAQVAQPYIKVKETVTTNVNNVKKALNNKAEKLKLDIKAVDKPIDTAEFSTTLDTIEKPVLVSSDTTLNNAYGSVIKKAKDLLKGKKTVGDMLDARKSFDQFIEKQFPNLYNSESLTPMKSAIKDVRNEFNNFIDRNLPDDLGYRQSLKEQSLLYDAIDNMSTKGAKEVGTNSFQRALKKNPKKVETAKTILKLGGAGIAGKALLD